MKYHNTCERKANSSIQTEMPQIRNAKAMKAFYLICQVNGIIAYDICQCGIYTMNKVLTSICAFLPVLENKKNIYRKPTLDILSIMEREICFWINIKNLEGRRKYKIFMYGCIMEFPLCRVSVIS